MIFLATDGIERKFAFGGQNPAGKVRRKFGSRSLCKETVAFVVIRAWEGNKGRSITTGTIREWCESESEGHEGMLVSLLFFFFLLLLLLFFLGRHYSLYNFFSFAKENEREGISWGGQKHGQLRHDTAGWKESR